MIQKIEIEKKIISIENPELFKEFLEIASVMSRDEFNNSEYPIIPIVMIVDSTEDKLVSINTNPTETVVSYVEVDKEALGIDEGVWFSNVAVLIGGKDADGLSRNGILKKKQEPFKIKRSFKSTENGVIMDVFEFKDFSLEVEVKDPTKMYLEEEMFLNHVKKIMEQFPIRNSILKEEPKASFRIDIDTIKKILSESKNYTGSHLIKIKNEGNDLTITSVGQGVRMSYKPEIEWIQNNKDIEITINKGIDVLTRFFPVATIEIFKEGSVVFNGENMEGTIKASIFIG